MEQEVARLKEVMENLKECMNLYIEMKNGLVVVMLSMRNMNYEMD